jgi:hypothetical protein
MKKRGLSPTDRNARMPYSCRSNAEPELRIFQFRKNFSQLHQQWRSTMKTPMKTLGLIRIIGAAAATTAAVITLAFAATVGQAARLPSIAWSPVTSPGTFDYGTVDVGQAVSQTFALTNSGGSATGMLRASLSGSATFSITADGCTGTALGPGKSCNVTVHYAPTTAVQSTATLAANGTKPPSSASITLTGTGRNTTARATSS